MRTLRQHVVWQLFAKDLLQYLREPTAAFFTFAFPALLLTILGGIYGGEEMPAAVGGFQPPAGATVLYIDLYFPGFVGFIIANLSLASIPVFLAYQRESGYFRAIQVSPVSLFTVMLVRISVYFVTFIFSYTFMFLLARLTLGVRFHGSEGLFLLGILVSFIALGALGFLLGGMFRSPQATQATSMILFFLLYFTSGSAIPRWQFPNWLHTLTEYNPLTHVVELLVHLWLGAPSDLWWQSGVVVLGCGLVALILVPMTFKWEVDTR